MRKIRMMLFMAIAAVMSIISMGAEITFRVDMTVLWNGPLPKNVYIFPARTDGGKDSGMTQNGKTIELNYNESIRNNAKEQEIGGAIILTDTDLDGIYEGKVNATKTYEFNSRLYISKDDDNNNMENPIYEVSSENGTKNVDNMEWDKRYFKTDSTKTINWAWEEKYIYNFESLKNSPNTAGNTDKNNPGILEIQRGFSKRLILNAAFVNDEKVNRDVSKFVVMTEGDKNIADIEKIKDGSNISYVKIVAKGKKGDSTVIGLRVGDETKPGRYKIYYIKVVITDATSSSYTGEQTLIAKFNDEIATGDKIGLDKNMQTINGYDPRFAGLEYNTTESIINDSYSNPYFLNFASQSYGEGYKWWLPGITGNGLIIPLGKRSIETTNKTKYPNGVWFRGTPNDFGMTEMKLVADYVREIKVTFTGVSDPRFRVDVSGDWTEAYPSGDEKVADGTYVIRFNENENEITKVKDGAETVTRIDSAILFKSDVKIKKFNEITSRETAMDIKMPKVIDSTKIKAKGGIAPSFEWEEDKSNSTDYSDRYIIARISKIKTSLALTKLDPYAGKNPIINAAKDTTATGKFDSGSYAYIDYVFKGTGTEISSDGRAVKKEEYSGELVQKITVMNFPIGEYKVQIYSIKRGKLSNNYSVLTFETEQAFEITREDYESDATSTEDSYMIYGINPSRFDEIAVRFVTKTQKPIADAEMKNRITYVEGSTTESGVKEIMESSGSYIENTGKNNTEELESGGKLSVTKIQNDKTNQIPLDIVLCLDKSDSMNDTIEMSKVKTAWAGFEAEMSKRGYSVGYQMFSFYDGSVKRVTTKWRTTLLANEGDNLTSSFECDDSDSVFYEHSAQAIDTAADFMASNGRYYGYNSSLGSWGPVETKTSVPSQKIIVFITDSNPTYSPANALEEKIRGQNINLVGLGMVKDESGNKLVVDSLGYAAEYPGAGKHYGCNDTSYYDLKILLGDKFGWYQISNNSDRMLEQMLDGTKGICSTAVWEMKYVTPFKQANETRRRVDFYIKNMDNKTMVYTGTEEDRIYKAPKVEVKVEINTPTDDTVFEDSDDKNYKVIGTAEALMSFDNPDIDKLVTDDKKYYPLNRCELEIKKTDKNGENIYFTDVKNKIKTNITTVTNIGSNGKSYKKYTFLFNVLKDNIIDSGADEFYVKVKAVTDIIDGWSATGYADAERVKADRDPPLLQSLTIVNETTETYWNSLQKSDKTGSVFTTGQSKNFSTLKYKPFGDTIDYGVETTVAKNISFKDRLISENGNTYDGRFAKNGDKIMITAVFREANFDKTKWNENQKNYVSATFENINGEKNTILGTLDKIKTTGDLIVVTWAINIKNTSESDIGKITIEAVDNYRNKISDITKKRNNIGEIEIALIDNKNPVYPEWGDSEKPISGASKSALTLFEAKKESGRTTPVITNKSYQINCLAGVDASGSKVDVNGVRAFKVYYTYNDKASDWGEAGKSATGNHDGEMDGDAVGYFYVMAGDGINLDANGKIKVAEGFGVKTPNNNYGDDGKYIFKIAAVDKAGNETKYSSNNGIFGKNQIEAVQTSYDTIDPKIIYVDTRAPQIENLAVKKMVAVGEDNYVRNGAEVYITYTGKDFSAVTGSSNNYHGLNYPKYSSLIGGGDEIPFITVAGTQNGADNNAKIEANLRIGNGTKNTMIVNSLDGDRTVTVGAKDLAGNEATAVKTIVVDTVINTPVLKAYSLEGKNKTYTDVSESVKTINSAEPTSTNVHFTKHSSYSLNISNVDSDVVSSELIHNGSSNYKKTGVMNGDYNISGMGYLIPNYLNNAQLTVTDRAGNTAISNLAEIVADSLVGNGNGIITRETTADKVGSREYAIRMNFSGLGNEYAGIQKFELTGIYKGTVSNVTKTGADPTKTHKSWSISGNIDLTVPSDKVGTIIYIPGKLVDNLGNERIFNYKVLLPGKDINLKAQEIGSEKEIRTKVRVIDEKGNVDLQKSEETGKKAAKPPKKK